VAVHLFLVVWQGVSVPPGLWDRAVGRFRAHNRPVSAPETAAEYHAVYDEFKARGRRFFPDLIVEDSLVSTVVFLVVVAFAVAFGTPLEGQADPTNTGYVPRPEWYFLFLFQLLRYFPGSLEWVGVVVLPGLFFVFLFLLPFLDRGPRHLQRDKGAIGDAADERAFQADGLYQCDRVFGQQLVTDMAAWMLRSPEVATVWPVLLIVDLQAIRACVATIH